MTARTVIIDNVRYVPATEVSTNTRDLLRAFAALYWGWDSEEINDPKNYKDLRISVTDNCDEGDTFEDFIAELSLNQPR